MPSFGHTFIVRCWGCNERAGNKTKIPYIDRLNPRYAVNVNAEQRRRQAEAWESLNLFVRKHDGWVTSPPGKVLRIETLKGSELPSRLRELGYNITERGSTMRVTGAPAMDPRTERATGAVPSAFCEMDVIEITLSGK
jgi:hypothetical protein